MLEREAARLRGQTAILERVARGAPLPIVLDEIVRYIQAQLPGTLASILHLRDGHLYHGAAPDLPPEYRRAVDGIPIGPNAGSCGTAAYLGKPVIVSDIATDPLWAVARDVAMPFGLRSCWSVPISMQDETILGTFACYRREPSTPDPDDLAFIATVAHLAGIAMERDVREHERRLSQDRLSAQQRILEQVARATPLPEILELVVRLVEEQDPGVSSGVLLARDGQLWFGAAPSFPESFRSAANGIALGPMDGTCGPAMDRRVAVIVEDIATDPRWDGLKDLPLSHGYRASWSTPILARDGEVLGTLINFYREPRRPGDAEQTFVQLAAQLAAIAIERARDAEALQESEWRYRHMVETMREGLWLIDDQSRTTYVNEQTARMLGYSPQEMVGRSLYDFMDDVARVECEQRMARRRQGTKDAHDFRFRRKDGSDLWAICSANPIIDEHGTYLGALGVLTDITQRRELEEQLLQSQKMEAIGRLAGGVAHDFNNMLAVIDGYSRLLLRRETLDPEARKWAERIAEAGGRAQGLTRQLLGFSRQQVRRPEPLDLNQAVGEVGGLLERLLGEDVELEIQPSPRPATIHADRHQLQQILMNLAVNARDAMPHGGRLQIAVEQPAGTTEARLRVSDTGCGMDEATQSRIFEPFFTTKRPGEGTGLGLATVYGIVQQSAGRIRVDSGIERGTTFEISFPASQAPITQEPESVGPNHPGSRSPSGAPAPPKNGSNARAQGTVFTTLANTPEGHPTTILMVEDDELVRMLVREVLSRSGAHVLEAKGGPEAIRLALEFDAPIDLLLTDVVMPAMSGRELAERLTELRPGLRVLYMSGYTDDAVLRHGVGHDGVAFLEKPFTAESLATRVRELLASQGVR